ncbi:glutaredoxin family protein [soil metagenome]
MNQNDPSVAARVLLYSRSGCHLCEVALADVERICGDLAVEFDEVDVDTDPALRAEYGDRVPLIVVDGGEHGYFSVDEPRLRAALR